MKQFLMCSGGKDSMASVILCYEKGIHLDGIVFAEIMFSHEKNISAEHPEHVKWLYNTAIPTLENYFGYNVIVLKSPRDYISLFNHITTRSKIPVRNGKKRGFVLPKKCTLKSVCKIAVLDKWAKSQGDFIKILGIAYDEKERLSSLHKQSNTWSILENEKIVESQTFDICRKYNLLSPYYSLGYTRQGCWFCPNQNVYAFANFAKHYPELWNELALLSQEKNTVSNYFSYSRTFDSINRDIEIINNQLSIFDFI